MKKLVLSTLLVLQAVFVFAQQNPALKGKVIDAKSQKPLQNVVATIQSTNQSALTDFENSIVEMEKALNLKMDSIVDAAIDKGQNTMKIVKEKIPFKKHSSKEDDIEIFSKENIKQLFANMSKTSRAAISRVKGFRKSKKVDAKYMENALAEIKEHIKKGNTN